MQSYPHLAFQQEFVRAEKGVFCNVNTGDVIAEFKFPTKTIQDASSALLECEKYCSRKSTCQACSILCNESCHFSAISNCFSQVEWKGLVNGDVSQKPGKRIKSFPKFKQ